MIGRLFSECDPRSVQLELFSPRNCTIRGLESCLQRLSRGLGYRKVEDEGNGIGLVLHSAAWIDSWGLRANLV